MLWVLFKTNQRFTMYELSPITVCEFTWDLLHKLVTVVTLWLVVTRWLLLTSWLVVTDDDMIDRDDSGVSGGEWWTVSNKKKMVSRKKKLLKNREQFYFKDDEFEPIEIKYFFEQREIDLWMEWNCQVQSLKIHSIFWCWYFCSDAQLLFDVINQDNDCQITREEWFSSWHRVAFHMGNNAVKEFVLVYKKAKGLSIDESDKVVDVGWTNPFG